MKDPLAAAVMGPRLALGGATEALDLLQKGQLLGVLAQAPGELNTLLQDPRPINDKAEDLVRRAEGMVETLEERGIAAEAPGREIFKAILPADLYDRYLDPAAVGATQPPQPPPAEQGGTADAIRAEEDDAAAARRVQGGTADAIRRRARQPGVGRRSRGWALPGGLGRTETGVDERRPRMRHPGTRQAVAPVGGDPPRPAFLPSSGPRWRRLRSSPQTSSCRRRPSRRGGSGEGCHTAIMVKMWSKHGENVVKMPSRPPQRWLP